MSKRKGVRRTNKHHRLSRSRTGGKPFDGKIKNIDNVITVDYKRHQAFHQLFPDTHPMSIARELNDVWLDPDWMVIAVKRM